MKAYTSRARFDENRRFTFVGEEMGRARLDADANEQAMLVRTDARRRSGDVAEGSPDDGFLIGAANLLDPIATTAGWSIEEFVASPERRIRPELTLDRREPESLPHVVRVRGAVRAQRRLPRPLDLLCLPPAEGAGLPTYAAAALIFQLRFRRPPTDDEVVDIGAFLLDGAGARRRVAGIDAAMAASGAWQQVRVPMADLGALPRTAAADGTPALPITGWGFEGLPPRAEVYFDALLAEDSGIGEGDLVIRGGDGTLTGAGRIYVGGWRSFLRQDWRYLRQPDLPDPAPLARPADPAARHLVEIDVWERPVHGFQDGFIVEPALDGEPTSFRGRKVTQVRVRALAAGEAAGVATPVGGGLLTTNVPAGALPDRFPPEPEDPCRDRCLFTENLSTGEGYRGSANVHVRVEVLFGDAGGLVRPVLGWSRDNGSTVAPLAEDAAATALSVVVRPEEARRFRAGDTVVIEDERSRLDPDRDLHRARLRRLAAVDTATGRLEFHPAGHALTADPDPLEAGGPLGRAFLRADRAAIRRWDGADWLLPGIRYNLADGITFALAGADFRAAEYWSFTARVANPDGGALGVVETLRDAPVHGPWHARAPLALVHWTATGRRFEDLRARFMPLQDVRDRLIELGRRRLSPGAFTVVVGDGVRSFGDIDQDRVEGVTGDEAIQAALDRLGPAGGSIYVRAGDYALEHAVLIQGRSNIRILGDGGATRLAVRGAGGAFYIDSCGHGGELAIEGLDLDEGPPAAGGGGGGATLIPDLDESLRRNAERPGAFAVTQPLRPADLAPAAGAVPGLLAGFIASVRAIRPGEGRAGLAVLRTITRLRRLQREQPDVPLEQSAADELLVLRSLPHGVITVSDSHQVRLERLRIASREAGGDGGTIAAGVLITGSCAGITVAENRIAAPSGIVAAAYGRALAAPALLLLPRAGLFLRAVTIAGNQLDPSPAGGGSFGIRIADGEMEGIAVTGNLVSGFDTGISVEDAAETRLAQAVDRTVLRDNQVIAARGVGIRVSGDGVDIEANEVRLAAEAGAAARLRAAVQVTGARNRLRETWIALPPSPAGRPRLALEAGILVGAGDAAAPGARPVTDLEITGNRIEGSGAATLAAGVLVAGAGPVFGVVVAGNAIARLGDAAVRAMGHAGPVGGLQVEDNRIDAVALANLSWGPDVLADLAALAPGIALPAGATPAVALDRLLAAPSAPRAAIDALLRWLDAALLRGGVVLSLTEESVVRGNRIRGVGVGDLPAGFVMPGAELRTAAVLLVGGRDATVEGNRAEGVKGAVERNLPPLPPRPPVRPPVFDLLRDLDLRFAARPAVRPELHGATAALRRLVSDYAIAGARERQGIGARLYGAMEALHGALDAAGSDTRRLAAQLGEELEEMLNAQGAAQHTRVANRARATLSDAAAATAPDPAAADAWSVAARFDQAVLGDDAAVREAAQAVAEEAEALTRGLESLDVPLVALARRVVAAPGGMEGRLRLAEALGTLAEGRARRREFEKGLPEGGVRPQERAVFIGLTRLIGEGLGREGPAPLDAVAEGVEALATNLSRLQQGLAQRLRGEFQSLRQAGPRPDPDRLGRFRATLARVEAVARGEEDAAAVGPADLEAQRRRSGAELVVLSAREVDARIAALSTDSEAAAARNLRLLRKSATQLANLTADQPTLVARARAVESAIDRALAEPERRQQHQRAASEALGALQEEQARLAGIGPADAAATAPEPAAAAPPGPERVAALAQLVIELRTAGEAETAEGVELFAGGTRRALDALGVRPDLREAVLGLLQDAQRALGGGSPTETGRAAGLAALAEIVERLGAEAAERPGAPDEARALRALGGTLRRAFSAEGEEADRLRAVQAFVAAEPEALAASRRHVLGTAGSLRGVVASVGDMLGVITGVPLRPIPPIILPGILRLRAHPAEGIFAGGVEERLLLSGNTVEAVRVGAVVGVAGAHPLVPGPAGPGAPLGLVVEGNQILGATEGGLDLRLGTGAPVAASVAGNRFAGCCGVAAADEDGPGQAVLRVSGRGELSIARNEFRDNGNAGERAPLHEILLDWDGDVGLHGNRVRHAGAAGAGGAGIAAVFGAVDPALVRALSRGAPLSVEPPPAPPPSGPATPAPGLIDELLTAGLVGSVAMAGARRSLLDAGGLKLAAASTPARYAALEAGPRPAPGIEVATTRAQAWLDRPMSVVDRPGLSPALFDFLRRPPILVVPFPPPPRWSVQVTGNDIVANGPALLLLGGAGPVLSATVVGNDLESVAATAAAYLREVDTTIVANNRFEALRQVNVLVLRCRRSLVTISGNALVGQEPPVPPPTPLPPFRPRPLPRPGTAGIGPLPAGGVVLTADLGTGSAVSLPLDGRVLLERIRATASGNAALRADQAQASFGRFALRNAMAFDPEIVRVLAASRPDGPVTMATLAGGQARLRPVTAAGEEERPEAAAAAAEGPVRLAIDTGNLILASDELTEADKIFGLARLAGRSEEEAHGFLRGQLVASGGDGPVALARTVRALTGLEAATTAAQPAARTLLEEMLVLAVGDLHVLPEIEPVRPPPPPPPNPRNFSAVVLGGSRVAAVGNAATAGIYVQPGVDAVQLNP